MATGRLERTTENTSLYAQACEEVGIELNVPCLDLFHAMRQVPDYGPKYLNDGLHFSVEGHEFVFQQLLNAIQRHYPEIVVTPCALTGQYNNSASHCPTLTTLGPYHDRISST
jgi:hypothetical protein